MVDHDRLFKQLLSTFLLEFLELFAPELARGVEPRSLSFLEKETFTDAVAGKLHVVDLLARVRLRGVRGFVLVHVESQANSNEIKTFPQRMFRYFATLESHHKVPIYPVALLSFETPRQPQPDRYEMTLPGLRVLDFRFRQVQLNRLSWRDYVRRHNPVATALMSRMQIDAADRWRVKLECLRLLLELKLDPAKERLIGAFVDTYLKLDGRESKLFQKRVRLMPTKQREAVMELTTSWEEKGRREATADVALRLLRRRLGVVSAKASRRVKGLGIKRLERLTEDLLDFTTLADLDRWLDRRH